MLNKSTRGYEAAAKSARPEGSSKHLAGDASSHKENVSYVYGESPAPAPPSTARRSNAMLVPDGRWRWERVPDRGAIVGGRGLHAIASIDRGRIVLFGGEQAAPDPRSDSLLFDDSADYSKLDHGWRMTGSPNCLINPNGARPDKRKGHSLTYLPALKLVVLFGGVSSTSSSKKRVDDANFDGSYFNDVWLLSPKLDTASASPAVQHQSTLSPSRCSLPEHAFQSNSLPCDAPQNQVSNHDMSRQETVNSRNVADGNPYDSMDPLAPFFPLNYSDHLEHSPTLTDRKNFCSSYTPTQPEGRFEYSPVSYMRSNSVLSGGATNAVQSLVWTDASSDCQTCSDVLPDPRAFHSAVPWEESILVFGGYGCHEDRSVWELHVPTRRWKRWKTSLPRDVKLERRYGHCACIWRGAMLIFGGHEKNRPCTGETLKLSLETATWSILAPPDKNVSNRTHAAHVLLSCGRWLVLGGITYEPVERCCSDLLEFNLNTNKWRQISALQLPRPLSGAAAAAVIDERTMSVVVCGGVGSDGTANDHTFTLELLCNFSPYAKLEDVTLPVPTREILTELCRRQVSTEERDAAKVRISQLGRRLRQVCEELAEKSKELEKAHERAEVSDAKIAALQRDIEVASTETAQREGLLKKESESAQQEIEVMKTQCSAAKNVAREALDLLEQEKTRSREMEVVIAELKEEMESSQRDIHQLDLKNDQLKKELLQCQQKHSAELEEAESEREALRASFVNALEESKNASNALTESRDHIDQLYHDLKADYENLSRDLAAEGRKRRDVEARNADLLSELRATKAAAVDLQQQQTEDREKFGELETRMAKVMNELKIAVEIAENKTVECQNITEKKSHVEQCLKQVEDANAILKTNVEECHTEIIGLQRTQRIQEEQQLQLQNELEQSEKRNASLISEKSALEASTAQLAQAVADWKTRHEEVQQQHETTKKSEENLKIEVDSLRNKLSNLQNVLDQTQAALDEERGTAKELVGALAQQECALQEKGELIVDLEAATEQLVSEKECLEEHVKRFSAQVIDLETALRSTQETLKAQKAVECEVTEHAAKLESDLRNLEREYYSETNKTAAELVALQQQQEVSQQVIDRLQGSVASLKSQLEAATQAAAEREAEDTSSLEILKDQVQSLSDQLKQRSAYIIDIKSSAAQRQQKITMLQTLVAELNHRICVMTRHAAFVAGVGQGTIALTDLPCGVMNLLDETTGMAQKQQCSVQRRGSKKDSFRSDADEGSVDDSTPRRESVVLFTEQLTSEATASQSESQLDCTIDDPFTLRAYECENQFCGMVERVAHLPCNKNQVAWAELPTGTKVEVSESPKTVYRSPHSEAVETALTVLSRDVNNEPAGPQVIFFSGSAI